MFVKPIAYGLRRDETILEIIDNLDKLENLMDITFKDLNNSVKSFYTTLTDMSDRTELCRMKVNQLKSFGTKASKVFSHYKYPKNEISAKKVQFDSNLAKTSNKYLFRDNIIEENTDCNNNKSFGQLLPFDEQIINEKIKLFNVNFNLKVS